jgi:hypothetical protein
MQIPKIINCKIGKKEGKTLYLKLRGFHRKTYIGLAPRDNSPSSFVSLL